MSLPDFFDVVFLPGSRWSSLDDRMHCTVRAVDGRLCLVGGLVKVGRVERDFSEWRVGETISVPMRRWSA